MIFETTTLQSVTEGAMTVAMTTEVPNHHVRHASAAGSTMWRDFRERCTTAGIYVNVGLFVAVAFVVIKRVEPYDVTHDYDDSLRR